MERELKPGRLVIGRTPDNDLQIDSKFISRHHCHIVTHADSCVIEDLNSTNGIYVQSKRVRRYNLNDGDVVQVGQHEIMYIDERAPRMRGGVDVADTDLHEKPVSGTAPGETGALSSAIWTEARMVSPEYSRRSKAQRNPGAGRNRVNAAVSAMETDHESDHPGDTHRVEVEQENRESADGDV